MFNQGGNNQLRQLLLRLILPRSLHEVITELCASAWRHTTARRDAFIHRLQGASYEAHARLELRHWRALAEVREMFLRLLRERAPDPLNPPPPRDPHPGEDEAVDRAVLLHHRIGWTTAGDGALSSDALGDGQSHIGRRLKAQSCPSEESEVAAEAALPLGETPL
eukprot:1118598-Pyramimonas_sp.AAC.1